MEINTKNSFEKVFNSSFNDVENMEVANEQLSETEIHIFNEDPLFFDISSDDDSNILFSDSFSFDSYINNIVKNDDSPKLDSVLANETSKLSVEGKDKEVYSVQIENYVNSSAISGNDNKDIEELYNEILSKPQEAGHLSEKSLDILNSLLKIDNLSSIIMERMRQLNLNKNEDTEKPSGTSNIFKKISFSNIYTIITLISTIICIVSTVYSFFSFSNNTSFKFIPASELKHAAEILKNGTKREKLKEWSEDIVKINNWIRLNSREDLIKIIDPSSLSYMLYGAPGTGKSVFVQALAYYTDLLLKKEHFMKTQERSKIDVLSMYTDIENYVENNLPSRVEYIMITPSLINDKYVGESEKNVKRLFDEIYNFNDPYRIRIVFFDECESFFNKRSSGIQRTASEISVQTEFLTSISQHRDNIKGVFIFAATNMQDDIDEAFIRRFGNKCLFEKPKSQFEIETLIKNTLSELGERMSLEIAREISGLFKNTSQSYITRTVKSFIIRDRQGSPLAFDIDECKYKISNALKSEKI